MAGNDTFSSVLLASFQPMSLITSLWSKCAPPSSDNLVDRCTFFANFDYSGCNEFLNNGCNYNLTTILTSIILYNIDTIKTTTIITVNSKTYIFEPLSLFRSIKTGMNYDVTLLVLQ